MAQSTFGKILNAIKGPALAVASSFIPGGPALLAAYNVMVPDNKKLPATATGQQIIDGVNELNPADKAELMKMELQVELQEIKSWEGIQASMAKADISGNSTRPNIANRMAWVLTLEIGFIVGVIVLAIYNKDNETLKAIENFWPILVVLIGFPMEVIRYYFGKRTKEKEARYTAMSGQDVGSGISGIIKAFKK